MRQSNDNQIRTLLSMYECEQCGRCCRRERVTVSPGDIRKNRKLTAHIEKVIMMGYATMELPCHFISDSNTCTTYINRPFSCKRYPFFEKYPNHISISVCPYGDKVIKDLLEYCKLKGIESTDGEQKEEIMKMDRLYRAMGVGQEESFNALSIPIVIFNGFYKWITNDKKD